MATPTAQVLKAGMTAEALCYSVPFNVIPMVVTEVQSVIATGQFQSTDRLSILLQPRPRGRF